MDITKKVLAGIFGFLFFGIFVFVLTWGIINFNKVKDGISSTGLYTYEDLENAKQDGYNEALENKSEYDALISGYRDTITTLTDNISQLNSHVSTLTSANRNYEIQVSNFQAQVQELNGQIENLNTLKNQNLETISDLNNQITILNKQISDLTKSNTEKSEEIENLKKQVNNLQSLNQELIVTNEQNSQTITILNNQIITLNSHISKLTYQMQNNSSIVSSLNSKIAELEKSISYYEQYIASLESGDQIVVTFEFNGSVFNIQIINKNSTVAVVNPSSTDHVIFNYWTINNEKIDLSTYTFTTNTKVIANVTYFYDVKFLVDYEQYGSLQLVEKNKFATLPVNPVKDGFEFEGWTVNGIDLIDVTSYAITTNTNFIAKFKEKITFANASWSKISEISQEISSQDMTSQQVFETYGWNVGDEKSFYLLNGEKITIVILGFNHDEKSDGSGTAGLSLGMKNALTSYFDDFSDTDGWYQSGLRSQLANCFDLLPTELQNVIVSVNKDTSSGPNSSDIITSSDKLWLFSLSEIFSESAIMNYDNPWVPVNKDVCLEEGSQYEYFKNLIGDKSADLNTIPELLRFIDADFEFVDEAIEDEGSYFLDGYIAEWLLRSFTGVLEDYYDSGWLYIGCNGDYYYDCLTYGPSDACNITFNFCI